MADTNEYKVDGNSTTQHLGGKFLEWRVLNSKNEMVCAFYGPYSKAAADVFCAHQNKIHEERIKEERFKKLEEMFWE